MNRAIGLAMLVGGIILIITGIGASQSFSSDVSKFFTGVVTDKAMWFLVGGAAASVAGLVLLKGRNLDD